MKTYTLLMVSLFAVLLVGAGCATAETTDTTATVSSDVATVADGTELDEDQTIYPSMTLADVEEHNTEDDCWMIIGGEVYDVTDFIGEHPGGDQILLGCGTDATALFESKPATGTPHSAVAEGKLPEYQVGTVAR